MNVSKTNAQLTAEDLAQLREAITEVAGAEVAGAHHWPGRASLDPTGEWLLSVEVPVHPDLGRYADRPWNFPNNLPAEECQIVSSIDVFLASQSQVKRLALPEAVALLTGNANPEAEVARRRDVLSQALAAAHERKAAAEQARREGLAAKEKFKQERPLRWKALPPWVKALYLVAAKYPRTPSQALVALARTWSDNLERSSPPDVFEGDLADG